MRGGLYAYLWLGLSQFVVERQRPLAVVTLRFLDADLVVEQDPSLVDGERLGLQIDVGPGEPEDFTAPQALQAQPRSPPSHARYERPSYPLTPVDSPVVAVIAARSFVLPIRRSVSLPYCAGDVPAPPHEDL